MRFFCILQKSDCECLAQFCIYGAYFVYDREGAVGLGRAGRVFFRAASFRRFRIFYSLANHVVG